MENLKLIEEALRLLGIHDNMILTDTMNIAGNFIVDDGCLTRIDRMKITVDFEVQLVEMPTTNLENGGYKMTNGDWVRSLTNEQIAAFLAHERWNLAKVVFESVGVGITEEFIFANLLKWVNEECEATDG